MKFPNLSLNRTAESEQSFVNTEMTQALGGVALPQHSTDPEILGLTKDEVSHRFEITPDDREAEQKSAAYDATHPIKQIDTSGMTASEVLRDDSHDGYVEEAIRAISQPSPKAVIASAVRRHPKKGTTQSVILRHPQNPNETHALIGGIMKTFNEKPTYPAGSPYDQEFTKNFLSNVMHISPENPRWKDEYDNGVASLSKLHSTDPSPDNTDIVPKA